MWRLWALTGCLLWSGCIDRGDRYPGNAGPPPPAPRPPECSDAADNDGDALIDLADPGCESALDDDEFYRTDVAVQMQARNATILWVIDNSGSMCQEQQNLRDNFSFFLDAFRNAAPDAAFHMGVVTTDTALPGLAGRLNNTPVAAFASQICPMPPPAPLDCLTDLPDPLPKWVDETTPEIERVFGCLAQVGINGSAWETALGAARMALSPNLLSDPTANGGFLLDGSLLAIIILGDEDDCTRCEGELCGPPPGLVTNLDCAIDRVGDLTPVPELAAWFEDIPGVSGVSVSAIIGLDANGASTGPVVPDPMGGDFLVPICEVPGQGSAVPAPRIEAFTDSFELHGKASICDDDYGPALATLGQAMGTALNVGCLLWPPCDDVTEDDVAVRVDGQLIGSANFSLLSNGSCPGGYMVVLDGVVPLEVGSELSISYPPGPGLCP
ncbi:MAG TPA: hypothetical protein VG389_17010 [Myxococcota bacterium]|jgi:hypothetical protein|nr:hypothetical protein [Myxococcota bacterium]